MKIVLDAFGGDYSPVEAIKGAVDALKVFDDFNLVLVGDKKIIKEELNKYQFNRERIEILHSTEIITNDESPAFAIRTKKDSSIVVGLNYLKNGNANAFISAGSTGAVLTGAVFLIKRIQNVNRPALVPILPTAEDNKVVLVDCGANLDSRPETMLQFAKIGNAFYKAVFNKANPRVGLLNNGAEEDKGTETYRKTHILLKECNNINFIGNIEARYILSGDVDVVVADGFDGNIALKSSEGTALLMLKLIERGIRGGGLRAKLGYLLLKPVFKDLKKVLDYNDYGGAVLAGLEKIVVKTHGSSKAKTFKNAILQARELILSNIVDAITKELSVWI